MSSAARIEELQKKFDENPRRYFAPLANECRKAGDLDAAIAICRAHLPQQPGHMSGHIVYGQALFEAGELEEARTVFETALGLDPENLIALRHMGDISARFGDPEGARRWYVRVLETDPRNEEIQGLLAGLGGGAVPETAGIDAIEPESLPSDLPAATPDIVSAAEEHELPTLLDPALVAAAADAMAEEPPAPELLDFEPTSFTPPAAAEAGDRTADLETAPAFETNEAPAMAPDFALDGFEATSFEPPPAHEIPAIDAARDAMALEPDAAPLDLDATGFGATGLEPTSLAIPGQPAPAAPAADAFVTETMAELYLQQGYPDRALDVYRQLIAQNPDDAGLRERMARVERHERSAATESFATEEVGEYGTPVGADAPTSALTPGLPGAMEPALVAAAAEAAAPRRGGGPTIREYLVALATGQPMPNAAVSGRESGFGAEVAAAPATGGEIATVIDVAEEAPARDGLDQLFGSVQSDADLLAADSLAEAFSPAEEGAPPPAAPEANPLAGRPARPAGNDLSLDHVFGQPRQQGPSRPTGSFSFDQFFSEDAVRAPREESAEPRRESGDDDDLEQFNSWLKGLKNQ